MATDDSAGLSRSDPPRTPRASTLHVALGSLAALSGAGAASIFRAFQYMPAQRAAEGLRTLPSRHGAIVDVIGHAVVIVPMVLAAWLIGAYVAAKLRKPEGLFRSGRALLPLLLLAPCLAIEPVETRQIAACAVLGWSAWLLSALLSPDAPWVSVVERRGRWIAALLCAGGCAFLWAGAIARHRAHWSSLVDLGLFYELFDNAEGRLLWSPTLGQSFLGEHFSPILVLLTPIVRTVRSPTALLGIQTVALGLSGWLLFLWAEGRTGQRLLAIAIAAAWLLSPFVQNAAFYDFHMDTLEPAMLFGLLLAIDRKKIGFVVALSIGLWMTKEDSWIYTAILAMWALRDPRIGATPRVRNAVVALGAVGVVAGLIVLTSVLPKLRAPYDPAFFSTTGPAEAYAFVRRYSHLGGSIGEIVRTLVTDPIYVVRHLFSGPRLGNLAALFIAFLGLGFHARWGLLLLIPTLEMLLGDPGLMSSFLFYYGAVAFMFAPLAAVTGAERRLANAASVDAPRFAIAIAAVTAALIAWHPSSLLSTGSRYPSFLRTAHQDIADGLIAQIPEGAAVSATGYLAVHLQPRRDVRMFPYGMDRARWVLLDLQRPAWPLARPDVESAMARALTEDFSLQAASDGLFLLRRDAGDPNVVSALFTSPQVEAELSEQTGFLSDVHPDPDASNGAFRRASPEAAHGPDFAIFGPFTRLAADHYRASFRLRWGPWGVLSTSGGPLAPAQGRIVATIDVVSHGGREVRASRDLTVASLSEARTWKEFPLDFTALPGDDDVEFRVFWHGIGALDVDVVSVGPRVPVPLP